MTTVYGGASAGSADLRFAYDAALQAARELWRLAEDFEEGSATVSAARADAVADFLGPMRVQFDEHNDTNRSRLSTLGCQLRGLGGQVAADWAAARGEQDRINFARYVAHQKANEGFLDDVKAWFVGDKDYGSPPSNPPVPQGPGYAPTRGPMYADFGP